MEDCDDSQADMKAPLNMPEAVSRPVPRWAIFHEARRFSSI